MANSELWLKQGADGNDACPSCGSMSGTFEAFRGVEVGHVFYLGDKYSKAMGAKFTNADGKEQLIEMGCYGIGVTRCVGAMLERRGGIGAEGPIFPTAFAPFQVGFLAGRNLPSGVTGPELFDAASALEEGVSALSDDVLVDDRHDRRGLGFPSRLKDMWLSGCAWVVIVQEDGKFEIQEMPRTLGNGVVTHHVEGGHDALREWFLRHPSPPTTPEAVFRAM